MGCEARTEATGQDSVGCPGQSCPIPVGDTGMRWEGGTEATEWINVGCPGQSHSILVGHSRNSYMIPLRTRD